MQLAHYDPSKGLVAVKTVKSVPNHAGVSVLILPNDEVYSMQPDGTDGVRPPGADGSYERCRVSGNLATFQPDTEYYTRAFVVVADL